MRIQVVTLFPELIEAFASVGLMAKACDAGILRIQTITPRLFTSDRHQTVDDAPYGGGSGMVMMLEPIAQALETLDAACQWEHAPCARRILLSPQGEPFTQQTAVRLAQEPAIALLCGRYEGIDDRVRGLMHEEISLGDYVLNGGEVAAVAIIEAVSRLLPGMLGNAQSLQEESHTAGLLEYPQFTRPRSFRGMDVPSVLLSGNHAAIARWRRQQALLRTRALRPDLFAKYELTADDRALLAEADDEGVFVAFSDPPPRDVGSSEEPPPAESHRAPRSPAA
jgi:tRNA (guanine37-N1)-methyltransferase